MIRGPRRDPSRQPPGDGGGNVNRQNVERLRLCTATSAYSARWRKFLSTSEGRLQRRRRCGDRLANRARHAALRALVEIGMHGQAQHLPRKRFCILEVGAQQWGNVDRPPSGAAACIMDGGRNPDRPTVRRDFVTTDGDPHRVLSPNRSTPVGDFRNVELRREPLRVSPGRDVARLDLLLKRREFFDQHGSLDRIQAAVTADMVEAVAALRLAVNPQGTQQ